MTVRSKMMRDSNEALRRELSQLRITIANQELSLQELDKVAKGLVRRDFELAQANEELREVDRLKSEFVAVAAHQLRTPLSGLKWALDMFLQGEVGTLTNEQRTVLLKSYESNDRMIKLVNDLLNVDRLELGRLPLRFVPTNLLDLLNNVLYEVVPQVNRRQLQITFKNQPTTMPLVSVDQEKMRLVFQNLLENAVNYTMPGGHIDMGVVVRPKDLLFTVADNGIGIPKEQQPYIFNRFFRAKNAIKIETDGSGLGLFIAKGIIEKHGGKIWLESNLGQGTTFSFTIPISK